MGDSGEDDSADTSFTMLVRAFERVTRGANVVLCLESVKRRVLRASLFLSQEQ